MTRDNVERVARAVSIADHKKCPDGLANGFPDDISDWDVWIARAAMAATLELAAEDLRQAGDDVAWSRMRAADWLLSRANELKETDGE